jgi:hypothetical protein
LQRLDLVAAALAQFFVQHFLNELSRGIYAGRNVLVAKSAYQQTPP